MPAGHLQAWTNGCPPFDSGGRDILGRSSGRERREGLAESARSAEFVRHRYFQGGAC